MLPHSQARKGRPPPRLLPPRPSSPSKPWAPSSTSTRLRLLSPKSPPWTFSAQPLLLLLMLVAGQISAPPPAPTPVLPPVQQFGGGTWDAFAAAPAPAPAPALMQQFGSPASNDFGNFQSSEAAKPAVDKKVAGLIDMDDLLGSKKTETTSVGAGKGTPMNAMKPMGATKMGPGSSSGFGAAGGFGASPMMPMSGAPSMGMGASAPMGGMGQTMMNPQMGGMGMVSLAPRPFPLLFALQLVAWRAAFLTLWQGMGMGGGMNPQMGMQGGMGMVSLILTLCSPLVAELCTCASLLFCRAKLILKIRAWEAA